MARRGVVDGTIGKQDIIIHTVDKKRCKRDNKQKLTEETKQTKNKKLVSATNYKDVKRKKIKRDNLINSLFFGFNISC